MSRLTGLALTVTLLVGCSSASVINDAGSAVSEVGFVSTEQGFALPAGLRARAIGFEGSWRERRPVEPVPASLVGDALPFATTVVAIFGNTCQPSVALTQEVTDELLIEVREGDTHGCGDAGVFWLMGLEAGPDLHVFGIDTRSELGGR